MLQGNIKSAGTDVLKTFLYALVFCYLVTHKNQRNNSQKRPKNADVTAENNPVKIPVGKPLQGFCLLVETQAFDKVGFSFDEQRLA